MILTAEQKQKYLDNGASACPVCASVDISGGSVEIEASQAWQNISCADCGAQWRDVYTLEFVETDEELNQVYTAVRP